MALTKFTTSMDIISALADEPNDVGGLTAAQLKAKFDEGCKAIQSFVNNTLTTEIDANFATKTEVQSVVLGQIPDGTITAPKLSSSFNLPIEKGGTGATTPEAARSNLGIVQTITGTTAPTTATVGALNQLYVYRLDDGTFIGLYTCTKITGAVYTWKEISPYKIGDVVTSRKTDFDSTFTLADGGIMTSTLYPNMTQFMTTPTIEGTYQEMSSYQSVAVSPASMEYANGYFVHVGTSASPSAYVSYSDDFVNWTTYYLASGTAAGVVVKDGKFHILVNLTDGNCKFYSATNPTALANWTITTFRAGGSYDYLYGIRQFKVLNNKFVIIACRCYINVGVSTYYYDEMYTTTNPGTTESTVQLLSNTSSSYIEYLYDVAFDGTGYTIYQARSNSGGWIKYSNGTTLVSLVTLSSKYAFAIAYVNGRMCVYTSYAYNSGDYGLVVYSSTTPATAASWSNVDLITSVSYYTGYNKIHIVGNVLYLINSNYAGSISALKFTAYNTYTQVTLTSNLKYAGGSYNSLFKAFADVIVFACYDGTNKLTRYAVVGNFLPLVTITNGYGYVKIAP